MCKLPAGWDHQGIFYSLLKPLNSTAKERRMCKLPANWDLRDGFVRHQLCEVEDVYFPPGSGPPEEAWAGHKPIVGLFEKYSGEIFLLGHRETLDNSINP